MRLNPEIASYLKQLIQEIIPGSTVYLFGSRADDLANGGDIDLMILTEKATNSRILRKVRLEFNELPRRKRTGYPKSLKRGPIVLLYAISYTLFQHLVL